MIQSPRRLRRSVVSGFIQPAIFFSLRMICMVRGLNHRPTGRDERELTGQSNSAISATCIETDCSIGTSSMGMSAEGLYQRVHLPDSNMTYPAPAPPNAS